MKTAQDGGKVASLTHLSPLSQEILLVLISVRGCVDPGTQGDGKDFISMKNPLTQSGIEPANFRFVAQHLNHCATDFHSVSFLGLHRWKLRHLATVGWDSAILFIRPEPILGTLLKLGASVTLFVVTALKGYF